MEPYKRRTRTIDGKRVTVYAHREVWVAAYGPIPPGMQVDHINGDKRDNRLENLRIVTKSQNGFNRGANKNSSSGVKGLTWVESKGHWLCQVKALEVRRSLRTKDRGEAIEWLRKTREELHGVYRKEEP